MKFNIYIEKHVFKSKPNMFSNNDLVNKKVLSIGYMFYIV